MPVNVSQSAVKSAIPPTWKVPDLFRSRLGESAGRQRAMASEGHLLIVLLVGFLGGVLLTGIITSKSAKRNGTNAMQRGGKPKRRDEPRRAEAPLAGRKTDQRD